MELQSAQRTTSTLLSHRPMDTVSRNTELRGWRVKSLHFWGENPTGRWTLKMRNAVPRRHNRGMHAIKKLDDNSATFNVNILQFFWITPRRQLSTAH